MPKTKRTFLYKCVVLQLAKHSNWWVGRFISTKTSTMNKKVSCQNLNHCMRYKKCLWNFLYPKPKKPKKRKKKNNICWNWKGGLVSRVALVETTTFATSFVAFVACIVASTPFVPVAVEFLLHTFFMFLMPLFEMHQFCLCILTLWSKGRICLSSTCGSKEWFRSWTKP